MKFNKGDKVKIPTVLRHDNYGTLLEDKVAIKMAKNINQPFLYVIEETPNGGVWVSSKTNGIWESAFDVNDLELYNPSKFIGYKAPYDLFNGLVPKGTIYTPYTYISYAPKGATSLTEYQSLPAEIVKTWEKAYEETENTILVGDKKIKVTISKDNIQADGKHFHIGDVNAVLKLMNLFVKELQGLKIEPLVKVGCTTLGLEDINLIVNTYKELN